MKLNDKQVIYIYGALFQCNDIHLNLVDALKILKEVNELEKSFELSKVRNIFNMNIEVKEFKEIFKLV